MQKQKRGECLKYGQIVSISPLEAQQICVYSEGFIKNSAMLTEIHEMTISSGCRYQSSLFKIYPAFVSSRLQQALELEEELKKQKYIEDESKKVQKIQEIQQKVIVEYKMNIETSQKQKDVPLSFNQSIQFLHITTNKFMTCNFKEAWMEKENFKLELEEFPSQQSCFKLVPAFQHQFGQDAQIYAGDSMYIVLDRIYIGMQPYLNLSVGEEQYDVVKFIENRALFTIPNLKLLDRVSTVERKVSTKVQRKSMKPKQGPSLKKPVGGTVALQKEVNVSLERCSPWVINIFADENNDENSLYFGDIIWIQHIEENSILCLMRNSSDELIISFQNLGMNSQVQEFQGDSNGMFQLEDENMKAGGFLQWGQPVRFRHMSLGKYLAINYDRPINNKGNLLLFLSDLPIQSTLFQLVPLPQIGGNESGSKSVTKDAFFKMKTAGTSKHMWVHFEAIKQLQKAKTENVILQEEDVALLTCRITDQAEDEDVLKLYKVKNIIENNISKANYSEIMECNFLISCFPVLRKGLLYFKNNKTTIHSNENQIEKTFRVVEKMTKVLTELDRFCNNLLINTKLDVKNNKAANQNRQKVLRELFFIELMIEIMICLTTEEELKKHDQHQREQHARHLRRKLKEKSIKPIQSKIIPSQDHQIAQNQESSDLQRSQRQMTKTLTNLNQQEQHALHQLKVGVQANAGLQTLSHLSEKHFFELLTAKVNVLKLMYKLLSSICEENQENQYYVYKKFHQFLYQARYFKEATDCIIRIIGGNEQILGNLCDEIELNEKKKNLNKNKSPDESSDDGMFKEDSLEFNSLILDQINQNVLLYFKTVTEQSLDTRNIQFLQFFQAICRYKDVGITVNQEMIFKFMKQSRDFDKALFMPITIETTKMKVTIGPKNIVYLTSVKDPEIYNYLVTQLKLFADLALDRNHLWKYYLQERFPTQFVFDQIFDDTMNTDYRSAFCSMAISAYVDHEPFQLQTVPTLCRLVEQDDVQASFRMPKMNAIKKQKFQQMLDYIETLVDRSFAFVNSTCDQIESELIKKSKLKSKNQQLIAVEDSENYNITNQLVLDITNLINLVMQFDMLTLLKKKDKKCELFPNLIKMLEFDRNNMLYSYILQVLRKNKIAKAEEGANKLLALKNAMGSAVQNLAEVGKALTISILGIPKKQQDSLEVEFSEYDTTVIQRNPIIGSLVTATNHIEKFNQEDMSNVKNKQVNCDLQIKMKICDLVGYLQDQRQEFYIANFVQYFKDKGTKLKAAIADNTLYSKLEAEIDDDLATVLPPCLRTGIESIDNQAKSKSEALQQPKDIDLLAVGGLLKLSKKFTNLLKGEAECPDLDTLLSGKQASIMKSEILPSLLITFYITTDMGLLDKLLLVIRKSFSQKKTLFSFLEELELLFDQNDIQSYYYLQSALQALQQLTQSSEIWLVDFLAEPQAPDNNLQRVLKSLTNIHSLLYHNTQINEKGQIIPMEGVDTISFSRQKTFDFLGVQIPLVGFIRDTQNQLTKVLRDPFYSSSTKELTKEVLVKMYACLRDFCQLNGPNQTLLFPDIQLFLDEIEIDLGQIDLICAIFQDNKLLCEQISEPLLNQFLSYLRLYGREERFLKIFVTIQSYRNTAILENQIRVRKLFIPKQMGTEDYVDISEYQLYGEFKTGDNSTTLQFDFSIQSDKLKDEPYKYHGAVIDLFLESVKGDEGFKLNVPHIKSMFNLHYFLELLLLEDDMMNSSPRVFQGMRVYESQSVHGITFLKPKIVRVMTVVYISNTVLDQFLFIKEQPTFTALFRKVKIGLDNLQKNHQSAFMHYFFDELILMMKSYSEKLIQKDGNGEFREREDYTLLYHMVLMIQGLASNFLNGRLNQTQYNNLVKFIYSVDEQLFKSNAGLFSQCLEQGVKVPNSRRVSMDIPQDDNESPQKIRQAQTIFSKGTTVGKKDKSESPLIVKKQQKSQSDGQLKQKFTMANKNIILASNLKKEASLAHGSSWYSVKSWEHFLKLCSTSRLVKEEIKIELGILCDSLLHIDQFLPEQIVKELNISMQFKDILKKLIRFVELGIINKADKNNLIFVLELLENILNQAEDLVKMQDLYDSCQATKMFLNLLGDFQNNPFDNDILLQLMKFACIMSRGGNKRVQTAVYNYLSNFENSELIFLKMNSIIFDVIEELKLQQRQKQQRELLNQKSQFTNIYLSQAKDINSETDQENQQELQQHRRMKKNILIELLQFYQLLCEGHNLNIQNYLRYQFNNRTNYNIVQSMVELLCVLQNDLQQEWFEVIMNTLDTLTELVQGPCGKNQQDIIDGKFLDVASSILNMRITKRKGEKLGTPLSGDGDFKEKSMSNISGSRSNKNFGRKKTDSQIERWMHERLKYKCMVLVTSLLELNSDEMAIKRIMRSLPIQVLKENLIIVYKKNKKLYNGEYTKEALNHVKYLNQNILKIHSDPKDLSLGAGYHELILEIGFFIYFLISYYSELSSDSFDVETSEELQKIKEEQQNTEGDALADMKNNIIGQLLSLAWALTAAILTTINSIRTYLQDKIKQTISNKNDEKEDLEKKALAKKLEEQKLFSESIKFFSQNSASIEVIRNGNLERILFYKLSYCHHLPKETKTEFHEKVDRDSVNSKISDLIDESDIIVEICKHEETLALFFQKNKFIAIFANYVILWKDLAFLLTLTLNILIILSYYEGESDDPDERKHDRIYSPRLLKTKLTTTKTLQLFQYCGIVMIICSSFVVSFFLLKKGPLYAREAWNKSKDMIKPEYMWIIRTGLKLFLIGNTLVKVLMNVEMLYYLTYVTLAFMANFIHPFFFAFHLSEVVIRYPLLRNIIRSFWEPKLALMLTFILIILLNYFFTLFSYIVLYDIYSEDKCNALLTCFIVTFDYAFKNNGGIGGWFDGQIPQNPDNYSYTRFFYDNLYNIAIVMISMQIFSGIIIDTFGSLREKLLIKENDISEICFICGLQRDLFDRRSGYGFKQHVKEEHYMWNYIFYLAYLINLFKNKSELNGIETYIYEKKKNFDNSWFPIGKALGLEGEDVDLKEVSAEQMGLIEDRMASMKNNLESISKTVLDIKTLKEQ